jgi:hypothetical protein
MELNSDGGAAALPQMQERGSESRTRAGGRPVLVPSDSQATCCSRRRSEFRGALEVDSLDILTSEAADVAILSDEGAGALQRLADAFHAVPAAFGARGPPSNIRLTDTV